MSASKKQPKKTDNINPLVYIGIGVLVWIVGYAVLLTAIDSGSIVHWVAVIVALFWGGQRIIKGVRLSTRKLR